MPPAEPLRTSALVVTALAASGLILACCAGVPATPPECSGLAGSYREHADGSGESLSKLFMGRSVPGATTVRVEASGGQLSVAANRTSTLLPAEEFVCASPNELRFAHDETSSIRVPPLIDQTRTTSRVLRGGPGKALVLSTYSRTTAKPYGLPLTGPLQLDSTTSWSRETH